MEAFEKYWFFKILIDTPVKQVGRDPCSFCRNIDYIIRQNDVWRAQGVYRAGRGKNVGPPLSNDDFISEFDIITRLISMQNKPGECMLGRFRKKRNQIFVLNRKIKGVIWIENKTFFEILKLMFFSFLIKHLFLIFSLFIKQSFIQTFFLKPSLPPPTFLLQSFWNF